MVSTKDLSQYFKDCVFTILQTKLNYILSFALSKQSNMFFFCHDLRPCIPKLNHAGPSAHFVCVFERSAFVENDSFLVIGVASGAAVSETAVILEHRFCFRVAPVHSGPSHPALITVGTHCVVSLNFAHLALFFKPLKRIMRSAALRIKGSFESCLRGFDFLGPAIDESLPSSSLFVESWRRKLSSRVNLELQ